MQKQKEKSEASKRSPEAEFTEGVMVLMAQYQSRQMSRRARLVWAQRKAKDYAKNTKK